MLSGFELYLRWVPLGSAKKGKTAVFYKDFYHREMWYLNTRKNTIFLHVKLLIFDSLRTF